MNIGGKAEAPAFSSVGTSPLQVSISSVLSGMRVKGFLYPGSYVPYWCVYIHLFCLWL